MKKSILQLFGTFAITASLITGCSSTEDTVSASSFVVDPTNFQGTITSGEVILNAGTVYKLTGKIQVNEGATLTIPAGTLIDGVGGTSAYIAVAQGGKIFVNGTASNPVVMTSGLATKRAGDWGGLVICGRAPINRATGGTSVAQSEVADLSYGGTIANDNSGSVKYLRIEYAGAAFNTEKEFNGASLFGVGSGTVFENVQAYHGSDDGFEFFGGTVNTSNLVSIGNEDDQFDWTEGWSGTNINWYGKIDFNRGNRGIEADNFELGYGNTPIANPKITNLTLVGPGNTADATIFTENNALKLRRGTKGMFTNLFLSGWNVGLDVENDETIAFVGNELKATNVTFDAITTKSKGKTTLGVAANVSAVFTESSSVSTGAGAGKSAPTWSLNWAIGF